jgi:hypothetical protein
MSTTVWAWRPLVELNGQTGLVDAGPLAQSLIDAGVVQDPRAGALHLNAIEAGEPRAAFEVPGEAVPAGTAAQRKPRGTVTK